MKKISITVDLLKINKAKIYENKFTTRDGVEVTEKLYKMDVVPVKEKKVVNKGENWEAIKTHFVSEGQTKQERENKADTVFLGEGITFQTPQEVAENAMKEQVWEDYLIKQRNPEYPSASEQGITFKTPTAEDLDVNPDDIGF